VTYLIVAYSWSNRHCWQPCMRGLQDLWQRRRTKACSRRKHQQYKLWVLPFTLRNLPCSPSHPLPTQPLLTLLVLKQTLEPCTQTWFDQIQLPTTSMPLLYYHTVLFKVLTEHVPLICRGGGNPNQKQQTPHHLSFFAHYIFTPATREYSQVVLVMTQTKLI